MALSTLLTCILVLSLLLPAVMATTLPDCTGPKVAAVETTHPQGNPPTPAPPAGGYATKIDSPTAGSLTFQMEGITYKMFYEVYGSNNQFFKFWTENDHAIVAQVIVKGGPSANIYTYSPAVFNDCNLVSPDHPNPGEIPGVSHVNLVFAPPPPPAPGSLEVTKSVVEGSAVGVTVPDFLITITGPSYPNGDTKTFNSNNGYVQTWTDLIPGVYTVTEANPGSLWTVTGSPVNVTVYSNQKATATVTNTHVAGGSLEVTKTVDTSSVVGDVTVPDFEITITGPSYPDGDTKTFNSTNGYTQAWTNLIPGNYAVTEVDPGSAWTVSITTGNVTVTSGQKASATVTNTYGAGGSLEVTKSVVLGDVVGDVTVPDFFITITGPSYPSGNTKTFNEANGYIQAWSNLLPGNYTVTEAALGSEWDVEVPANDVAVVSGQEAKATVKNTYVPGELEITKVVLTDAPVLQVPAPFAITITGPSYPSGDTKYVGMSGGTLTWSNLIPGDYTVSEEDPGSEWIVTVPANAVAVTAGQKATATVTNDWRDIEDETGTITIVKFMNFEFPDSLTQEEKDEWIAEAMDQGFLVNVKGPDYDQNHTIKANDNPKLKLTNMTYGSYEVTEIVPLPAGYVFEQIVGGSFTLGSEQRDVTVDVTNKLVVRDSEEPGSGTVIIRKVIEGGTAAHKDIKFTILVKDADGVVVETVEISENDGQVSLELDLGDYTIEENVPEKWTLVSISHPSITVTEESTHSITVTNRPPLPETGGYSLLGLGALLGLSGVGVLLQKRRRK